MGCIPDYDKDCEGKEPRGCLCQKCCEKDLPSDRLFKAIKRDKPEIEFDTSEFDNLLLDILFQACSFENSDDIDNMCISAYENACDYLASKGYLKSKNGRIYVLTQREEPL